MQWNSKIIFLTAMIIHHVITLRVPLQLCLCYFNPYCVTGLQKQGMLANKFSLLFQTYDVLWWYAMAVQFSTVFYGYTLQVTECK